MLRIGMFIADRYEILAHIGTGGMSEVYKAKCHKLNRFVAIKVLKTEFAQNPDFVVKFRQEAQSAAILSHPNIVSIFDVGDEDDIHYIVMELIEGITLKDYISNKGKLDLRESIGITIQVAQGLAAAHEQHIIHRDIKPQNIIISKDAKVKVMDFGIARATSGDTINSNSNMGSVHYISPEQARGGYCDERSDLYSLGVTLYEMLTGEVPFDGENTVAIALAHIQNEIPAPRDIDPSIPSSLEKIILKCMMKKPERRYSSAMELIGDLRKALIMPEEDFVKVVPPVNTNPTKMMSQEEITAIRDQSKAIPIADSSAVEIPPEEGAISYTDTEDSDLDNNDVEEDDFDDDEPEEKENSKFDVIVLVLGIILALIIIVLAIFLVTKIIGMNNNNPDTIKQTITDEATTGESTTGDSSKQVKVPDLIGMTKDDIEDYLSDYNLGTKFVEEYSEDHEEGEVIGQDPASGEWISKYSTVTVTISIGSEYVKVPDITGLTQTEAQNAIYEAHLYSKISKQNDPDVAAGLVISTDPVAGTEVSRNDIVNIVISLGKEVLYSNVPDLKGLTVSEIEQTLEELNLNYEIVSEEFSSEYDSNEIISQDLTPGTEVEQGSTIKLVVSKGAETVKVKDMVKHTEASAKEYFEGLGLKVTIIEKNSDTIDSGCVISQSIPGGESAEVGSEITLTISKGPEDAKVPSVVGLSLEEAVKNIEEKGFIASADEYQYSDRQEGTVISQSPTPEDGNKKKGITVRLVVSKGAEPTNLEVSYGGANGTITVAHGTVLNQTDFTVNMIDTTGAKTAVTAFNVTPALGQPVTTETTYVFSAVVRDKTVTGSFVVYVEAQATPTPTPIPTLTEETTASE